MMTLKHNIGETVMVPMTVVAISAKVTQDSSDIQYRLEHKGQNTGSNVCVFDNSVLEEKDRVH